MARHKITIEIEVGDTNEEEVKVKITKENVPRGAFPTIAAHVASELFDIYLSENDCNCGECSLNVATAFALQHAATMSEAIIMQDLADSAKDHLKN